MALQDDFREIADCVRGIAADFGVRPYAVAVEVTEWSGTERGEGASTTVSTAITEGEDSNPPKVEFLGDDEIVVGDYAAGAARVGPITPDYDTGTSTGGTSLSLLAPSPASKNSSVRIRLTGPRHPSGALFRIDRVEHHRGYQYSLVVSRVIGEGTVV